MNDRKINKYKNSDIILYGASKLGINMLNLLNKVGIKPIYFCDSDNKKIGKLIGDIEIISLEEIKRRKTSKNTIIVITSMYIDEILYKLQKEEIKFDVEFYLNIEFVIKSYLLKNKINSIKRIKDVYTKERCFIIGNGPSLNSNDLDKLLNEYTFGSNNIHLIYKKTKWRPNFYACLDCAVLNKESFINKILKYESEYKYMFLTDDCESNSELRKSKNIVYLTRNKCVTLNNPQLNYNIEAPIYIYNVTAVLIEIAIYMGFKEIYLIGVDNDFGKNCKEVKHFDNNYNDEIEFDDDYNVDMDLYAKSVYEEYKLIYKYSINSNVKIYNATRGGKLEIFERVDFDKLKFK